MKIFADDTKRFEGIGLPKYVHLFQIRPHSQECILKKGKWVLLVFANVSSRDTVAIRQFMICVIHNSADGVRVGLRPFEQYNELEKWHGEYGATQSPLWIVMEDGQTKYEAKGQLTEAEMADLFKK